jgi:hypothetical protein
MVLPPQRRARPLPYTGKVLKKKVDSWHHSLSPSSRQDRLESILLALKGLAGAGLGTASVLANLHHRRIVPLMERELRIYEMSEAANPMWLARSRLLHDRLSYGPPWAHYISGYQDRLLGGPLGLPDLCFTAPAGVKHKDYGGEVIG